MHIHPMWDAYPVIKKELSQTAKLIEKSISLKNKAVEQHILSMLSGGGKMLRPAYQLLFSQFGSEQQSDKKIALAAAIETLHTATLIHDDIVDEAAIRRNFPTIQATYGKDVAVYAGDYLFIICFKLLGDHVSSLKSIQLNSRSMEKILAGELGQMSDRYNFDLTTKEYLNNISGKTAELFALSCFIGAYEAGCSPQFSQKCQRIGRDIGIAFQIVDDLLDYSQSAAQIGKPVLEDVRQGVYSLPLLFALEENRSAFLPLLMKKEAMTNEDALKVFDLVQTYGGVTKAKKIAEAYTEQALKKIADLPETEQQTAQALHRITLQILQRNH